MKNKWKLYRCIYDEMGLSCVEGETGHEEQFKKHVKEGHYEISWLIGTAHDYHGNTIIRTELEGKKENLDLVLELINQQSATKQNRGDLKGDK